MLVCDLPLGWVLRIRPPCVVCHAKALRQSLWGGVSVDGWPLRNGRGSRLGSCARACGVQRASEVWTLVPTGGLAITILVATPSLDTASRVFVINVL